MVYGKEPVGVHCIFNSCACYIPEYTDRLRSTDKGIREMADVFHIPWIRRIRYIIMPQLSPYLISAGRVTAGMAWKAGVAAEIIGMPKGSVGQMLYMSKIYLDTDDLLAWTVIIVVLSVIFEKLIVLALKAALKK